MTTAVEKIIRVIHHTSRGWGGDGMGWDRTGGAYYFRTSLRLLNFMKMVSFEILTYLYLLDTSLFLYFY